MKIQITIAFFLLLTAGRNWAVDIVPTGTGDDAGILQEALDSLHVGDTIRLNGDFVISKTIYLPSDFTWILNGSLALNETANLDRVGWVATGIDARRPTGITEKPGGATNIEMSGGTYYGYNVRSGSSSIRFINFVSVTHSYFHDFTIIEGSDDGFTLGPGSNNNECRNLVGSGAHGNALTDKGDRNKWYDCIAEECDSDGWTPKCRYSEFHRCIGRRNGGPGFGMYARIDGSGDPVDLGDTIVGNKFYDCEAYDNNRGGFDFDISSTCGEGALVKDNYVQAICHNNRMQGVFFRNKRPNSLIDNNVVNIVAYGNLGQKNDGSSSIYGGGVSTEGSSESPVRGISGWVICYDNKEWDVNTDKATNCSITVYNPFSQAPAVLKKGGASNIITVVNFNCSDVLEHWCQQAYCSNTTVDVSPSEAKSSRPLSHNFPNPFSENIRILYMVPAEGHVSIKVYDPSGKEQCTLVDEFKQQGQYMTLLNRRGLPGGTLYYRITAGRHTETKKIVHIK